MLNSLPFNLGNQIHRILGKRYDKIVNIYYTILRKIQNKSNKQIFSEIYLNNLWGSLESYSGPGSTLSYTNSIRLEILNIIEKYNIKTMLDAPCGDMNWIEDISLRVNKYIGADIVVELVNENKKKFANEKRDFIQLDIVSGSLPTVDLIFCRHCFQHLSINDCILALSNFIDSNSKYILLTTYPFTKENMNTYQGGFSPYNLCIAPFNLPEPIEIFLDGNDTTNAHLGMWRIDKIIHK
jgi:hypothetical protein